MKKIDKRWLLFLALILLMALGFPYLSLNHEARTASVEQSSDVKSMSIALVNEDDGAEFNGESLTFGEAFVRSLDNSDEHDWYVVSRGVAESGLNRDTYDMMIVIPKDFSEKALSINSEAPEQVVLHYRINAGDDEYVKAEAEKTASTILNEFNRRIIDVYFTSIIGNLQDAQDHVTEIVDKQRYLTNTYNTDINQRLSGYTNQFDLIRNNSQASRDGFSGLQSLLEDFEDQLVEDVDQTSGVLSQVEDLTSVKQANQSALLDFSNSLQLYHNLLRNQDAENSLEQLQQANKLINYQLQQFDEGQQGNNIVTEVNTLKGYVKQAIDRVDLADQMLVARLNGLDEEVDTKVSTILTEIMKASEDQEEFIKNLFVTQDKNVREKIKEQISNLPSLNESEFEGIGLPDKTVNEIKRVIAVTEGYNKEFEHVATRIDQGEILSQYLERLKTHLSTNGMTLTDTVWIPENEKKGQKFTLEIPKEYELTSLKLKFPGEDWKDFTDKYKKKNKLKLRPNQEGKFGLSVSVKLIDKDQPIDVFEPVNIGWELKHQYIDEEEIDEPSEFHTKSPDSTLIASTTTVSDEAEESDAAPATTEEENNEEAGQELDDSSGSEENSTGAEGHDGEEQPAENGDGNEETETPADGDNGDEGGSDGNGEDVDEDEEDTEEESVEEPEEKIKKLTIFNNRISHQITKPIENGNADNATTSLIKVVTNTVSPYQKLSASYEQYFGTRIMKMNPEELKQKIAEIGLKNLASEEGKSSLYNFFNNTDIKETITEAMVNRVIESITIEIKGPLSEFQEKLAGFRNIVSSMSEDQFEKITEEINTTRTEAQKLNENLAEILNQVADWRDESVNLLEAQEVIQTNDGEEQTAMMTLASDFQPLLSNSQFIAEQAHNNLNNADIVYETLDTIDNQVDEIEQSGANLVTQADQLAVDLTEKTLEDEAFTENFAGVLANSRVGERQNENLYDFLSNPVKSNNEGTGTLASTGINFTPYYLVLTMFIVVLFTAYVISTLQQKRKEADQFAQEQSLMGTNTPITIITAGIGVLEGIAIGVISSMMLGISDGNMLLWVMLITALMAAMLLVATYLLRQLKMLGMFVLLIVLSMYLFSANAFGAGTDGLGFLREYSPLQYIDRLLTLAVTGNANYLLAMFVIIAIILIGALANLLVINREEKGDLENEGSEEAS